MTLRADIAERYKRQIVPCFKAYRSFCILENKKIVSRRDIQNAVKELRRIVTILSKANFENSSFLLKSFNEHITYLNREDIELYIQEAEELEEEPEFTKTGYYYNGSYLEEIDEKILYNLLFKDTKEYLESHLFDSFLEYMEFKYYGKKEKTNDTI